MTDPAYLAGAMFAFRVLLFGGLLAVAVYRWARPLQAGRPEAMQPMIRRAQTWAVIAILGLATQAPRVLAPPERIDLSTVLLCVFFTAVTLNGVSQLGGRR